MRGEISNYCMNFCLRPFMILVRLHKSNGGSVVHPLHARVCLAEHKARRLLLAKRCLYNPAFHSFRTLQPIATPDRKATNPLTSSSSFSVFVLFLGLLFLFFFFATVKYLVAVSTPSIPALFEGLFAIVIYLCAPQPSCFEGRRSYARLFSCSALSISRSPRVL